MNVLLSTVNSSLRAEFRTVDIAIMAFLIVLSALEVAFRASVTGWQQLVFTNVAVLAAFVTVLIVVQHTVSPSRIQALVRIVSITAVTSFIYNEMGNVIHMVFPYRWDETIHAVESSLFGVYPSLWLEKLAAPWLTELMMFAYVIYVPLIPAIALVSLAVGRERQAEQYMTELTLAYLVCYFLYIILPVEGPSRALVSMYTVSLDGYFFTAIAGGLAAHVHLPGGAFPSAHCAAAVVMTAALYRFGRVAGHAFLVLTVLIFVSTVYGRFHYITDVAGGIIVGILALRFASAVQSVFDKWTILVMVSPARDFRKPQGGATATQLASCGGDSEDGMHLPSRKGG